MKKLFLLLSICFSCSMALRFAWGSDLQTFEFNGLELGSSLASVKDHFPEFSCVKDHTGADQQTCNAIVNFHRRPGVINSSQSNVALTFRDNQLIKIDVNWSPTMFKKTVSEFKKYYGKPSKVAVETFTTADGDMLENMQYYWQTGRESIVFQQYANDDSQSSITFSLQQFSEGAKTKNVEIVVNWNDIAGKTAKGKEMINEFGFKDYFNKNGNLVEVRDNGSRHRGKWKISDSGYLCFEWKNTTDCGQLKVNEDNTISFVQYDKVVRQFYRLETQQ